MVPNLVVPEPRAATTFLLGVYNSIVELYTIKKIERKNFHSFVIYWKSPNKIKSRKKFYIKYFSSPPFHLQMFQTFGSIIFIFLYNIVFNSSKIITIIHLLILTLLRFRQDPLSQPLKKP